MLGKAVISSGVLLAISLFGATHAAAEQRGVRNIVLVHGAWVDGSGWKPVYDILTRAGYTVSIVQEPLTSFEADVAATRRVLSMQPGSCILVGHSYGGSVITEAGNDLHVAALVYVAAHMPEAGESEATDGKRFPSDLAKSTFVKHTPDGFNFLDPSAFPAYFAADLPAAVAQFEAKSQVLTAIPNFSATITTPAWRTKPSWMIVAGSDRVINPDLERWYASRAKSHVTEILGASHSVYESRAKEVAAVIEEAAQSTSR
jgi:pimeloyl-ACP methyl ester carboxylesterase